jgi:hypothetical protein
MVVSTTQRSSWPVSTSAGMLASPTSIGVGSPSLRLNWRAMRSGSVTAWRSAASPATNPPSGRSHSTDGTVGPRSPSPTISAGRWGVPSWTAAAV